MRRLRNVVLPQGRLKVPYFAFHVSQTNRGEEGKCIHLATCILAFLSPGELANFLVGRNSRWWTGIHVKRRRDMGFNNATVWRGLWVYRKGEKAVQTGAIRNFLTAILHTLCIRDPPKIDWFGIRKFAWTVTSLICWLHVDVSLDIWNCLFVEENFRDQDVVKHDSRRVVVCSIPGFVSTRDF